MKVFGFVFSLFLSLQSLADGSVYGKWKTIDEEGKAKSIVEITLNGDSATGQVIEIFDPEKVSAVCEKCKGDMANKPILGMKILSGLKETTKGEEWSGGQILDPNNGKTYRCLMRPKEGGKKLEVRGYIGFSLFGRTQVWHKQD